MEKIMIKCSHCGTAHEQSLKNCCWINCECGERVCGNCGGTHIVDMEMAEDDYEAKYWCCLKCADCDLEGCALCI